MVIDRGIADRGLSIGGDCGMADRGLLADGDGGIVDRALLNGGDRRFLSNPGISRPGFNRSIGIEPSSEIAPGRGRRGGDESELFKADLDCPTHRAFPRSLRLARPLTPGGGTHVVASKTRRLPRGQVIRIILVECLPQPLQFKNQRGALRSDVVAAGLGGRAPRGLVIMLRALFMLRTFSRHHDRTVGPHDGTPSGARRTTLALGATAAGCFAAAVCPFAVRTRANISSDGPNAIALPS